MSTTFNRHDYKTAIPQLDKNIQAHEESLTEIQKTMDAYAATVVETGTSGKWAYRKWSDGTFEAWYNSGATTVTTGTSSGDGWYRNTNAYSITPPQNIGISSLKFVTVNAMVSGYANSITSLATANTSTIEYYVSHLGSLSNQTAYILGYITGTWA